MLALKEFHALLWRCSSSHPIERDIGGKAARLTGLSIIIFRSTKLAYD